MFRSLWLFFLISSFLFAFSYSHIYLSYFFFIIINAFYHSSLFFFVRCCSFAPPCFFFWFVLFYSVFFITIIFSLASSFFLIYFSIFFYYFLLFFSSSYFHDRTCSFLLSHSDLFLPRFFFELRWCHFCKYSQVEGFNSEWFSLFTLLIRCQLRKCNIVITDSIFYLSLIFCWLLLNFLEDLTFVETCLLVRIV